MSDLLSTGAVWLNDKRHAYMTRTVSYTRKIGGTLAVSATVGRSLFEVERDAGVIERVETRDYILSTAQLVAATIPFLPADGDLVVEVSGGAVMTYAVLSVGSEPSWRYVDSDRLAVRVHAKLVSVV